MESLFYFFRCVPDARSKIEYFMSFLCAGSEVANGDKGEGVRRKNKYSRVGQVIYDTIQL